MGEPTTGFVDRPPSGTGVLHVPAVGIVGSMLVFFVIGGSVSLYGPALPSLPESLGIAEATAALMPPLHGLAAVAGILAYSLASRRVRPGILIPIGLLAAAAGAAGAGTADSLVPFVASVVSLGVAFGALGNAYNMVIPRDDRPTAPAVVNAMHGLFAVGAVSLPLVLSFVGYRTAFVVLALLALAILPFTTSTPKVPLVASTQRLRGPVLTAMMSFIVLFAIFVGVEASTAAWFASMLESAGSSEAAAARMTSGWWLAFAVGRFLIVPFSVRLRPVMLLHGLMGIALGLLVVAHVADAMPVAMLLTGLVLGPLFPTSMVWLARTLTSVRDSTALVLISGMVGASALPALIGVVVPMTSTRLVPTVLLVAVTLAMGVVEAMRRRLLPAHRASEPATPS